MPAQKPGKSRQDYETPREFLDAVELRWGPLDLDLAARKDNAKAQNYIPPERDSLSFNWEGLGAFYGGPHGCNGWLNPPFSRIEPWAAKCASTKLSVGERILFLVPASVGAAWFTKHVHNKAHVYALTPRLCFDGKAPFPKDCILAVFGETPGFSIWRWK